MAEEQESEHPGKKIDWFETSFVTGRSRGQCGRCGHRTKSMGSEAKAIAALADHRRDVHGEKR